MSLRPLLRRGVLAHARDDGWVLLEDPPAGLVLPVSPEQAPLLDHLGDLALEEILQVTGVPEPTALRLLKSLAMTGFLLGCDEDGRRERVEARATGPERLGAQAPFSLLIETRFACGSCGACCRSQAFGPLSAAEVTRLEQLAASDPGLGAAVVRRPEPGPLAREVYEVARRDDGRCVFLTDANRCRVHEELGAEAKPLACQVFPFAAQPGVEGVTVHDTTRCATFAESSTAGPPLHETFDAWRPVLRAAARRSPGVASGAVGLPRGLWATDPQVRATLGRALEVIDHAPPEVGGGRAWELARNGVTHWLAALGQHGVVPDLARRAADDLADLDAEALAQPASPPVADHFHDALQTVWQGLRAAWRPGTALGRAVSLCEGEGQAAAWDPALSPVLRRALRQRIHGLRWDAGDSLAVSMLRELLRLLLSAAGARLLAADRGAERVEAPDLSQAQAQAARAVDVLDLHQAVERVELQAERVLQHGHDVEARLAGAVG
jgi:Fe-S-cluster containining protein